jgi:hypothetical protein
MQLQRRSWHFGLWLLLNYHSRDKEDTTLSASAISMTKEKEIASREHWTSFSTISITDLVDPKSIQGAATHQIDFKMLIKRN